MKVNTCPKCGSKNLTERWSDFQYVRHNANLPLEGVTVHGNGSASFQMMPSTRRFGQCYDRLPKWLRKLATIYAARSGSTIGA
jgi:hypothetical protein